MKNENIQIIKTKRKSIAIEVKRDLSVVVHVPVLMSNRNQYIGKQNYS